MAFWGNDSALPQIVLALLMPAWILPCQMEAIRDDRFIY